jgi:hypothetical protein
MAVRPEEPTESRVTLLRGLCLGSAFLLRNPNKLDAMTAGDAELVVGEVVDENGACTSSLRWGACAPEIAEFKLDSAEVGVIVVGDGESDVDCVSGQERRFFEALGHVPA